MMTRRRREATYLFKKEKEVQVRERSEKSKVNFTSADYGLDLETPCLC